MLHVFKLEKKYADLFIYDIDFDKRTITYEVRDKDDGKLREPRQTSRIFFTADEMLFDDREIDIKIVAYIVAILDDLINEQAEPNNQVAEPATS